MAFHFSLETVLRVRRGQERSARLKLEAIVSEQSAARAKLEKITETRIILKRRFQEELKNILNGSELQFEATRESNRIRLLTIAPLVGEAVRRIADESSVSSLFD